MRKFNLVQVQKLERKIGNMFQFVPFPGKIPVHLMIRIRIMDMKAAKWRTRCQYHGKWSYEAYRQAVRIWNGIPREVMKNAQVYEYCPTGLLYAGNLFNGVHTPIRNRIFYTGDTTKRPRTNRPTAYAVGPAFPMCVGKQIFLCLDAAPAKGDPLAWGKLRRNCLNNYKAGLGGLHYVVDGNA